MTFWETQMAHEPTKKYYERLKEIVKDFIVPAAKYDVLEIGLDVGISARCFLEFPNLNLTSIDCGDVEGGVKNIEEMNTGRWVFHHQSSDVYFSQCKRMFNIIYVDGDHTYTQVKKDIYNAWEFMNNGGLLIAHDFLHRNNFKEGNVYDEDSYGVAKAVAEFLCDKNLKATIYPPHPALITIKK